DITPDSLIEAYVLQINLRISERNGIIQTVHLIKAIGCRNRIGQHGFERVGIGCGVRNLGACMENGQESKQCYSYKSHLKFDYKLSEFSGFTLLCGHFKGGHHAAKSNIRMSCVLKLIATGFTVKQFAII